MRCADPLYEASSPVYYTQPDLNIDFRSSLSADSVFEQGFVRLHAVACCLRTVYLRQTSFQDHDLGISAFFLSFPVEVIIYSFFCLFFVEPFVACRSLFSAVC